MSYIKIWVHTVWATKDGKPYLIPAIKYQVIEHICENAKLKNIQIDQINGYVDHLHCLVSMSADQNIATVMNLIKGESSFWINKHNLTKKKFGWQDEYIAVSIGQSQLDTVRNYIRNQEFHHQKKTFQQEYDEFMKLYRFDEEKG